MNDWAKIFLKLLALNDKFNILSSSDDTPGEIDKLRTAVIKSCSLFASRYESESSDHLQTFVEESIKLLATLDDKERYDVLVAETTNYVQTVVKQKWNKNLFDQQKLEAIISRILIRNIRLRGTFFLFPYYYCCCCCFFVFFFRSFFACPVFVLVFFIVFFEICSQHCFCDLFVFCVFLILFFIYVD